MQQNQEAKFFHCYATANDNRLFIKDILNLVRLKHSDPGVEKVMLYIAISKVKPVGFMDRVFVNTVRKMFAEHPSIELQDICFKENKGRDFSSYATLYRKVKQLACAEDYIFFQNRSAFGPFENNWLKAFVKQLNRFPDVAMCGSTINFQDHHERSNSLMPHVQTYVFITKQKFLKMFGDAFPAESEEERLQIILKGEIGLSQFFLQKGYRVTCMEWPEKSISATCSSLSGTDIKTNVCAKHQFYHRKYFRRNKKPQVQNPLFPPVVTYIKAMFK
ncbi:hypothetical protein FKX85_04920 [Echinicola soli]|uniref:Core-2/I-Branching enzyme n=1 Tax=Echinicola soli TaxID=2591634 RepID=A0A514CF69_9BACT|nr:hypothetical protein [Echinicola soli]QDH78410.1 hypothetical protein FKX85_04920 [Echinicola soli]